MLLKIHWGGVEDNKTTDNESEADGLETAGAAKATASDSSDDITVDDETIDGDVIDDTSTGSNALDDGEVIYDLATAADALEDGEVATASNANAIMLLSTGDIVNPKASSFLKLDSSITGSIATPSDFAIGKAGTKTMKISYLFDFQDIAEGERASIGAEIVVPKGFDVDESTIQTDSNWTTELTTNEDGDNLIVFKNIGNLTTLRQTLVIVQDAQYLINHLSERHIYTFSSRFYNNYGNENQALVVKSEGAEATDSFTFEADNTTPTWTVDPVCNNETWKPVDILGTMCIWVKENRSGETADDEQYTREPILSSNHDVTGSFNYDSRYMIVKYKKSQGYIPDNVTFKFLTEKLPIYMKNSKYQYAIIINYKDIDGNIVHIQNNDVYDRDDKYNTITVVNGEYTLKAAQIANLYTGDNIKQFKTQGDLTISDILYNEGYFEIKIMPYLYYNKVFYENNWKDNKIVFTSSDATAVTVKSNESNETITYEGDPIKIEIINGTDDQNIYSASVLTSNNIKIPQSGTAALYNDMSNQPIRFSCSSQSYPDWKVYDNFTCTIEYKELSGDYEEALYPVKLTGLLTDSKYGLTYRIHIKNLDSVSNNNSSERIVTIVGMKNSTLAYDYIPAVNEIVLGNGLTSWDGTTGEYKLSETEYVSKIEITKEKFAANYLRKTWSNILATATLRAQHKKLSKSIDIPSGTRVNVVMSIKSDDHVWKEVTQTAITIHSQDNLELLKKDADFSIQVNRAVRENGVLGVYTLKKYPDTMIYNSKDPAVVVLSGDGATITDRVSAINQRLLYIVDQDENIIDVTDNADIKANDYIVRCNSYFQHMFSDQGKDTEHIITKNKTATFKNDQYNAYRNRSSDTSDNDTQLYNLTALYEALNIDYAKELVISQDYANDWLVTNEGGETWSKFFYANQIKPHYLNYDNLIGINGKDNTEPVQLTYKSELFCKVSDWLSKKATDSNAGKHGIGTAQTQNISRIVYGGEDFLDVCTNDSIVIPALCPYYSLQNSVSNGNNVLAEISTAFNEDKDNIYIDYDNVEYDFTGTDKRLLSITTGVGMHESMYQLSIEYTTSDGQTHTYWNSQPFSGGYSYVPLEIDDGTYITGIKVRTANEDFTWSRKQDWYSIMQGGLPKITLCIADSTGVVPTNYPSSGEKIGYQKNIDIASGRIYDQLPVKCTISYEDIFGNKTSKTVEGKSARIAKSIFNVQYTETVLSTADTSKYRIEYSNTSVNTGDTIYAKLCPDVFFGREDISKINKVLKSRPVFYYAIDKDFIPDTANIEGLPANASAVYYPAGTEKGCSGNESYGYLVVDLGDVSESDLPTMKNKYLVKKGKSDYYYGWIYGPYTIPLITSYEASEGDRTPILHMWTDMPHDSGRDGGSGNPLADIDVLDSACTAGAPDITDSTGAKISNVKKNAAKSPIMLYADLTSAAGAKIAVNSRAVSGMVPYVTESATGGISQDAVSSRDYTQLDKSKGLFGNKIYAVGDATNITTDFDIYIPVPKKGESNLADGDVMSDASQFSLTFKGIDISELKKPENAEGAKVYFTTSDTNPNPGRGGFSTMAAAKWESDTPSDASKITGIKVHLDKLMPGITVPFYVQYQLSENKNMLGTQTAYQIFYGDYKLNGVSPFVVDGVDKGYTNPTVEQYILEDMSVTGFVWDETGQKPDSVYSGADKTMEGVTLRLYDENGMEISQTNTGTLAANERYKTAADGKYELLAPCDGKYTVKLVKSDEGLALVTKKVGSDPNTYSVGNQSDFMTDQLGLWPNYAQKKGSLTNINFGLYTKARLATISDVWVHAGKTATASTAFEGQTVSLPDVHIAAFSSASDASVADVKDNHNNTASVTGLKAGTATMQAGYTDLYGNLITTDANIISYINIRYNTTANGGSGEVADTGRYYPTSGSDAKADIYHVMGGEGVTPPAGYSFSGWATKAGTDVIDRAVGSTYSITESDITGDITLYAVYLPKEGTEYRIEYYRQKAGSPADAVESYEHYVYGDTLATGSTAAKVKAPYGYETRFADDYKINATLSDAELEKTIKGDGTTVVRLYYDIDYKDINWYDDDIEQDPPIKKAIASKYGKWPKEEQVFTFTMEGSKGAPLPDNTKATLSSADILNSEGAKLGINFGNITYSLKDAGKTYTYTIKEEVPEGGIKDYAPDKTAASDGYKMTVRIDIDGTKLKRTVIYGSSSSEADASTDGIVITNTYTEMYEPIKWLDNDVSQQNLPIKKAITSKYGKLPKEEQIFTFTMEGSKGAPLPDNTKATLSSADILSSDDAKLGIIFGNIEFDTDDLGKTYTYTIKEEVPEDGIKDYDVDKTATGNGYKMTVKIATDSNTNTLTKEVTYSDGVSINKDGIVITNTYTASYDSINWYDDGGIEQDPPIKKAIVSKNGKLPTTEQEFVFTMTGRNGAPLPPAREGETTYDPSKNMLIATLNTKEALKGIEFGNISFDYDDVGNTYEYVIQEVPQDIKNYAFDAVATGNGYKMTVKIASNSDTLTKEVTYSSVDDTATDGVTDDGIVITNIYTVSSSGGNGGGSSGGGTGKHAVNKTDTNPNTNQNNGDDIIFVEPKPSDKTDDNANHKYKYKLWDFLPKTGEERAMSFILLSMLVLVAIFGMAIFKKKDK